MRKNNLHNATNNPSLSVRRVAQETKIPKSNVYKTLKKNLSKINKLYNTHNIQATIPLKYSFIIIIHMIWRLLLLKKCLLRKNNDEGKFFFYWWMGGIRLHDKRTSVFPNTWAAHYIYINQESRIGDLIYQRHFAISSQKYFLPISEHFVVNIMVSGFVVCYGFLNDKWMLYIPNLSTKTPTSLLLLLHV